MRGLGFLQQVNETLSIIDTEALGRSEVVAAYLVRGKETALIDMGYASSASIVRKDLDSVGFSDDDLDYLLPTHVHLDHSGSCGKLAQWFPTARVIVHPKGEFHLTDPSKLVKSAGELFGDDLIRTFGLPEPIERRQVSTIANSEVISLGDGITLRAIWTPGHAPHHLSYLQEDAGVLFTGDAIGVQHPQFPLLVPTTPPPSFDLKQAIESIEHLDQFRIKRLATPHFGFKENAREQFRRNIEVLKKWEAQIKFLVEKKMGEQDILHELEKSIAREARQSLPDYLQLTLRLNVLGFTRYLKMHVE